MTTLYFDEKAAGEPAPAALIKNLFR